MHIVTLFIFSWYLGYTDANRKTSIADYNMDATCSDVLAGLTEELRERHREELLIRAEFQAELQQQRKMIEEQRKLIEELQADRGGPLTTIQPEDEPLVAEPKSRYTAIGCAGTDITLSCPGSRNIVITDAIYGEYSLDCSDTCCPPGHYQDCTMLASVIEPEEWVLIKMRCDNRTTCTHHYNSVKLAACDATQADYMQIYYDCRSVNVDEPVGFTAHASVTKVYRSMETVVFDDVQTNVGSYFNPQTSSFHCPHRGLYLFSITFQSFLDKRMDMHLVKDNVVLAQSLAYYYGPNDIYVYNHGASVVIVECDVGEVVWARSGSASGTLYGTQKHSQFSGYLLHRIESHDD